MERTMLRNRIKAYYGSVYRFAPIVGYTQSMLCKMLKGERKIYPYARTLMADLLIIPEKDFEVYFGEEKDG
jgi:hypothetical protein